LAVGAVDRVQRLTSARRSFDRCLKEHSSDETGHTPGNARGVFLCWAPGVLVAVGVR
jgi:hypothetical protein